MAQELEALVPQVGQAREGFETAQRKRRLAEQQRDEALALQRQFEARDALAADKARHLEQRAEVDNSQARLAQSTHAQALRPQKAALDQAQQALATAHDEQRQANAALITRHSHAEQAQQALETARQRGGAPRMGSGTASWKFIQKVSSSVNCRAFQRSGCLATGR